MVQEGLFHTAEKNINQRKSEVISILFDNFDEDEPELVSMVSQDELNFYGIIGLLQVFDDIFLTIVT